MSKQTNYDNRNIDEITEIGILLDQAKLMVGDLLADVFDVDFDPQNAWELLAEIEPGRIKCDIAIDRLYKAQDIIKSVVDAHHQRLEVERAGV